MDRRHRVSEWVSSGLRFRKPFSLPGIGGAYQLKPCRFVFVAGMLNGAYAVGTPDTVRWAFQEVLKIGPLCRLLTYGTLSHIAEEIPNPGKNVPIAIGTQMGIGFATGLCYIIAIMYAINDYNALFESPFPIAEIYRQATGSSGGAIGLLCLLLFCVGVCMVGVYITAGRTLWALARDGATPFPKILSRVSPQFGMPLFSTLACGCIVTVLGW